MIHVHGTDVTYEQGYVHNMGQGYSIYIHIT